MERKAPETSKSIFRNALYGFSTWILPLGLSFVATPVIVGALGNEDYGIYALVLGFIGYSFNLNTGRAVTKYVAGYRATGETRKINEVVSATLLLNVLVGLFGAVSIGLLAPFLVSEVFLIGPEDAAQAISAFHIAALIIFLTMLNQVFNSILQGLQRFDLYSKIYNAVSLLVLSGNILLALAGFGLNALLLWNLFVLFVTLAALAASVRKFLPEFVFRPRVPIATVRTILGFSAGIIGYQILSNFLLLFERGWVMRRLGEENLTFYVVPMLLGIHIHSFIASLLLVVFPLASELERDRERLRRMYLKATKFAGLLVVFPAVTLIAQSEVFLGLWMGREFAAETWHLLIIHVVTFSIVAVQIASWQMTEGLGYPGYNCFIFVFCLVIGVTLMVVLTDDYGKTGVALGRLAGFGFIFGAVFFIEKRFFGRVQTGFWLKTAGRLLAAGAVAGLVQWYLSSMFGFGWGAFLLAAAGGGLGYGLVLLLLGFIGEEDRTLFRRVLGR